MRWTIEARHLNRVAYVYVRQSSLAQVLEHAESRRRQCALAQRAAELGWAPAQVHVLDEDLGYSGRDADGRGDFQQLAQAVSQGRVGAIFALEVSRVARCSADGQQLLGLCRVTDVLIADEHAVYDPGDPDDRLILGVKGMMSESELGWMALRLHGARLSRARRGEYRLALPTGYVWSAPGRITVDPDEEVRRACSTCSRSRSTRSTSRRRRSFSCRSRSFSRSTSSRAVARHRHATATGARQHLSARRSTTRRVAARQPNTD